MSTADMIVQEGKKGQWLILCSHEEDQSHVPAGNDSRDLSLANVNG